MRGRRQRSHGALTVQPVICKHTMSLSVWSMSPEAFVDKMVAVRQGTTSTMVFGFANAVTNKRYDKM